MRRWLAAAGGAAVATLIVVACAEHAPQTPSQMAQGNGSDENGEVRAQETPSPPVFPTAGPTPQTFPSAGPTPATFPSAGPTPQTFPSAGPTPETFPSTSSPQPTTPPTAPPTTPPTTPPTSPPTPPPNANCPATTVVLFAQDTPQQPTTGGPSSNIRIPTELQNVCVVAGVKVNFRATAINLTDSSSDPTFYVGLEDFRSGGGVLQRITLIDGTNTSVPLSGASLGSGCGPTGGLRFENGGASFNTASAPYNGVFRPNANTILSDGDPGPASPNAGTFNDFNGKLIGTNWFLNFHSIPTTPQAAVAIQCWRLELTLRNRPGRSDQASDF